MATTKVNSEFIAINAISGTIIADGAITSTHLAANCVDSSELVTGSIDTIHIAANQVTATKIVTNGVLTRHISDDQVTADKLANSINTDIATGPAALPKAGGTMTGTLTLADGDFLYTGGGGFDIKHETAAQPIRFHTKPSGGSTTERMRIDSDGKVGIGTSSPSQKLHIAGAGNQFILINNTSTNDGFFFKAGAGASSIQTNAGSHLMNFFTGGNERLRIDSAGQIGIGGGNYGTDGQVLTSTGASSAPAWEDAAGGVDGITSSADATAITIDSSERIGIPAIGQVNVLGTIIPYVSVNGQNADQAHINIHRHRAAALAGYLSFSKSRASTKDFTIVQANDPFGTIDFQGADGNQFQQGAQITSEVDGTPGANTMPGRLVFKTTTTQGPAERMRIDSSGSLGLGTNNPGSLLHVAHSNGGANPTARIENTTGTVATNSVLLDLKFSGDDSFSNCDYLRFQDSSGEEGVITGDGGGRVYYEINSDYRLKENVLDYSGGLNKIKALSVKRYNYKTRPGTTYTGFLAHEVAEVVDGVARGTKDAVNPDGTPDYQGMDLSKLVPELVSAIQELEARVKTLEG